LLIAEIKVYNIFVMNGIYHFDNNFIINPVTLGELILFQLGETLCSPGMTIATHTHGDWFEFTYAISGTGKVYAGDEEYEIKKHDLIISRPSEKHKIVSSDSEPLRYIFCSFNFSKGSEMEKLINERDLLCKNGQRRTSAPAIENYFADLLSCINGVWDEFTGLMLESGIKTLVLMTIRKNAAAPSEYFFPKANGVELLCFNIVNYIDSHVAEIENLSDLADVFKYNYSYLSRCFKKKMNKSISDYFTEKKLYEAKTLLLSGKMSVTEVSEKLNYSSIYVFSRAFKNAFGISPSRYLAELK